VLRAEIARLDSASAQPPGDAERLKRLGIAWHNLAVLKVDGASAVAQKWLKEASAAAPTDAQVMVYLGSAQTMIARDSWNVMTKMSEVNKGTALIDKAVRLAPDDITVRMVRMTNGLALPGFFGRAPKAREDLVYLHGLLAKQTLLPATSAEICYRLGDIVQGEGDKQQATTFFEEARRYAPDSEWGKLAQGRLSKS
jgi:tetratricopeptide (TPR) repeat protein